MGRLALGPLADERRAPAAGVVARRRLHLDHACAGSPSIIPACGPGRCAGRVEHQQVGAVLHPWACTLLTCASAACGEVPTRGSIRTATSLHLGGGADPRLLPAGSCTTCSASPRPPPRPRSGPCRCCGRSTLAPDHLRRRQGRRQLVVRVVVRGRRPSLEQPAAPAGGRRCRPSRRKPTSAARSRIQSTSRSSCTSGRVPAPPSGTNGSSGGASSREYVGSTGEAAATTAGSAGEPGEHLERVALAQLAGDVGTPRRARRSQAPPMSSRRGMATVRWLASPLWGWPAAVGAGWSMAAWRPRTPATTWCVPDAAVTVPDARRGTSSGSSTTPAGRSRPAGPGTGRPPRWSRRSWRHRAPGRAARRGARLTFSRKAAEQLRDRVTASSAARPPRPRLVRPSTPSPTP